MAADLRKSLVSLREKVDLDCYYRTKRRMARIKKIREIEYRYLFNKFQTLIVQNVKMGIVEGREAGSRLKFQVVKEDKTILLRYKNPKLHIVGIYELYDPHIWQLWSYCNLDGESFQVMKDYETKMVQLKELLTKIKNNEKATYDVEAFERIIQREMFFRELRNIEYQVAILIISEHYLMKENREESEDTIRFVMDLEKLENITGFKVNIELILDRKKNA